MKDDFDKLLTNINLLSENKVFNDKIIAYLKDNFKYLFENKIFIEKSEKGIVISWDISRSSVNISLEFEYPNKINRKDFDSFDMLYFNREMYF